MVTAAADFIESLLSHALYLSLTHRASLSVCLSVCLCHRYTQTDRQTGFEQSASGEWTRSPTYPPIPTAADVNWQQLSARGTTLYASDALNNNNNRRALVVRRYTKMSSSAVQNELNMQW